MSDLPDMPRWIRKEEECLWCMQLAPLDTAYLRDDESAVTAWYICKNDDCEYYRRFNKRQRQGINYEGGFPQAWKKVFEIRVPREEEKVVETVVPTEVKIES